MLGGGEHFEDVQGGRRGANIRATRTQRCQTNTDEMPQTTMLRHINCSKYKENNVNVVI